MFNIRIALALDAGHCLADSSDAVENCGDDGDFQGNVIREKRAQVSRNNSSGMKSACFVETCERTKNWHRMRRYALLPANIMARRINKKCKIMFNYCIFDLL